MNFQAIEDAFAEHTEAQGCIGCLFGGWGLAFGTMTVAQIMLKRGDDARVAADWFTQQAAATTKAIMAGDKRALVEQHTYVMEWLKEAEERGDSLVDLMGDDFKAFVEAMKPQNEL